MRKSTWKEKPIFLRIVYLIAIIFECYIVISFTVDLVKSIILKQIVNIVSEVEALTLPGFLTNLTLSIYGILFWGFMLLTFCALITLIYRKIFKITCYKADRCKDKLLNKKYYQ